MKITIHAHIYICIYIFYIMENYIVKCIYIYIFTYYYIDQLLI